MLKTLRVRRLLFFFFTLVIGPRKTVSLMMSDARVYTPQIRARLVTATHFCKVVVCAGTPAWFTAAFTGFNDAVLESQLPHKIVNLIFQLVTFNNKLTIFGGS